MSVSRDTLSTSHLLLESLCRVLCQCMCLFFYLDPVNTLLDFWSHWVLLTNLILTCMSIHHCALYFLVFSFWVGSKFVLLFNYCFPLLFVLYLYFVYWRN